MRKVGTTYTKNGINYLVVDDDLIRKFKHKDHDAYYKHNGVTYSLGKSKNTVDVSSVTDMGRVFWGCEKFNADISGWDVSSVTGMNRVFSGAQNFNADISKWDVSSVADMSFMFYNAKKFNADISKWDVSSVTSMWYMFRDAHNFNADISNWDVSNVTFMNNMFYNAKKFNADISKWDVSSVTDMGYMFHNANNFNANISNWDVSSVTDMSWMFERKTINDTNNHNIPKWYTDRYKQSLTIAKQKEILEKYKDLPDEDKKAILKIIGLGLNAFVYKGFSFYI